MLRTNTKGGGEMSLKYRCEVEHLARALPPGQTKEKQ